MTRRRIVRLLIGLGAVVQAALVVLGWLVTGTLSALHLATVATACFAFLALSAPETD